MSLEMRARITSYMMQQTGGRAQAKIDLAETPVRAGNRKLDPLRRRGVH